MNYFDKREKFANWMKSEKPEIREEQLFYIINSLYFFYDDENVEFPNDPLQTVNMIHRKVDSLEEEIHSRETQIKILYFITMTLAVIILARLMLGI